MGTPTPKTGTVLSRLEKRVKDLERLVKRNATATQTIGRTTIDRGALTFRGSASTVTEAEDGSATRLANGVVEQRHGEDGEWGPIEAAEPEPVAPEESPALTATGTAEGFVIEAEAVHPSVLIEYHVSADPDFEPTPGDTETLSGVPTRSTVLVPTTLPSGVGFDLDETYYWRSIAFNDAGTAEAGPVAFGQLNPDAVASVVLARLVVGFVLAGEIQVGSHRWNPDEGLVIPQPNGRVVRFPADGSPIDLAARVLAYSLTVQNDLTIEGLRNLIAAGSGVQVAAGLSSPQRAPEPERFWPSLLTDLAGEYEAFQRGLVRNQADDGWVTVTAFFGGGTRYITDTGAVFPGPDLAANFQPDGGITRIGANYYVLGRFIGGGPRDGRWFIKRLSSSLVETAEWEWEYTSARSNRPAIGNDGTNVVVSWSNGIPGGGGAGRIIARRYTVSGADVGSAVVCEGGLSSGPIAITSVHWGTQTGATRIVVTGQRVVRAYNTSGVRQVASERMPAGAVNLVGMGWDGSRFHHLDAQGRLWRYSTLAADATRSIDYSWYRSAGPNETLRSPTAEFVQVAGSFMRITTDEPYSPPDAPEYPDGVRIWIDGHAQPLPGPGVTSAVYEIPATGGGAKAPDFPAGGISAGFLEAAAALGWRFWGDGATSFRPPILPDEPLLYGMHQATRTRRGRFTMPTATAPGTSQRVNFADPFPPGVVPEVSCDFIPTTNSISTFVQAYARAADNEGFTAVVIRDSGSSPSSEFTYSAGPQ